MIREENQSIEIPNDYPYLKYTCCRYHLEKNSSSDLQKITRFMTGKAIGLVLGGGGTKGWAHAGILKAFYENKIPIDYIGGTSVGSILAALYATSRDYKELEEKGKRLLTTQNNLFTLRDITIPIVAITNGKRLTNKLKKVFGDERVENSAQSSYIVSSNLSKKEETIFQSGLFWQVIRASISLPVFFPPMILDGDLYVDGSLLNNLSTDVMRDLLGPNATIFAADLSYSSKSPPLYNFG